MSVWTGNEKVFAPHIKLLVTEQIAPQNRSWPSFEGIVNIWVPSWELANVNDIKRRQAAGDEIWSYSALTHPGFVNWLLDGILAIRVESMSFLPGFAIATAAAALAGQYLGAGSREEAVRAVRLCWKAAVLLMSAMGVFFVIGREPLIGWMAPGSGLHLRLASPLLVVCATRPAVFRHLHHLEDLDARGRCDAHGDALGIHEHGVLPGAGALGDAAFHGTDADGGVDRAEPGSGDAGGDFHAAAFPREMAGCAGMKAHHRAGDPAPADSI